MVAKRFSRAIVRLFCGAVAVLLLTCSVLKPIWAEMISSQADREAL